MSFQNYNRAVTLVVAVVFVRPAEQNLTKVCKMRNPKTETEKLFRPEVVAEAADVLRPKNESESYPEK